MRNMHELPDLPAPDFVPCLDPAQVRPVVEDADGVRRLRFDMATIQSAMRLDDPAALELEYTRAMMLCLLFDPAPAHMLLVGLGGGSLARYVHRHLTQTHLTAVEINPHVLALRQQFSVPPDDARLQVVLADGADVVRQRPGQWNVLLVDAYHFNGLPPALGRSAFLQDCRAALAPGGVLVMNLDSDPALCEPVLARMRRVFDGGVSSFVTDAGSNRIALCAEPGLLMATLRDADARLAALPAVHRATLTQRSVPGYVPLGGVD